jgi:hypothetical protein
MTSYCIIQSQAHQLSNGNMDWATAEFIPTSLSGAPYVLMSGVNNPNDYTVFPVGTCGGTSQMTPPDGSTYYTTFALFCSSVQ